MKANRKELAILRGKRTPESLEDWAKAFGETDKKLAQKYALAIASFLGSTPESSWSDYLGQLSPNTRMAYAFAVTEFFEWIATKYDRVVPPHKVVRKDTEDYVNWLANRPFSFAEEKLKDGDMPELEKIFSIIQEAKQINIDGIAEALPPPYRDEYFEKDGETNDAGLHLLSKTVRQLITMDLVTGTPTLEELRKKHPQAGITENTIDGVLVIRYFTYRPKKFKPASRTTVALRVAALSSFWRILMRGENALGGEAVIQYNIWDEVKERVSRGLAPMKKAASREQKVPTEVVLQMLEKAPRGSLKHLRDRAILYLMVFSGIRTTELLTLRRGNPGDKKQPYFEMREPPTLNILRKGNKWMKIPYPPVALTTLVEFQTALAKAAAPFEAQFRNRNAPNFREEYIGYYYRDLLLPEAPLFPPLHFWGNNEPQDYRKSMSRVQLFRILRSLAEESGIQEDLVQKVHPHAIRHFSANAMHLGGKDLREIQAILGHASITTTEGYLEDVDDEVRLSGQGAIMEFLKKRNVKIEEGPKEQPQRRTPETYVDTYAVDVTDMPTGETPKAAKTFVETLPANELPMLPAYEPPEEQVVETEKGPVIVEEGGDKALIGLGEEPSGEELDKLVEVMNDGKSPGSPDHVYLALAENSGMEPVVFNRGGQADSKWLLSKYPKIPKDYGVGRHSLLPWFVKAKGKVSAAGFYRGLPPFPVFSPDQLAPSTKQGEKFLEEVEKLYDRFTFGEKPSPIRGVGLVKWFGFFAYISKKLFDEVGTVFDVDEPMFVPWESLIDVDKRAQFRTHKDAWLLEWLENNSHTYRASVDAMKRGVPKGEARGKEREELEKAGVDRDIEKFFAKASFEGVDLIEKMPSWMIEDDPVYALYRDSPKEYEEFSKWLRNVTGQALSEAREEERDEAKAEVLKRADSLKGLLVLFYEEIDKLTQEKAKGAAVRRDDEITGARGELRVLLYGYFLQASQLPRVPYSLKDVEKDSTADFNRKMGALFTEHQVPNPNDPKYKGIPRIKERIEAVIKDIFPEEQVLADANIFADSLLFDPRWFRIDAKKKTIFIEPEAAEKLKKEFGVSQSPTLLVRRAARAMYEARDKGYDKLWGVMMSYFAWIVPTGVQMEAEARGIPVGGGKGKEDRFARKEWLSSYVGAMKDLASGDMVKSALREVGASPGESEVVEKLEPLRKRGDVLGHAMAGVDFAIYTSADEYMDSPEEIMSEQESEEDAAYERYLRRTGYTKNGKDLFLHVEGERPRGWYKIRFSSKMKKNPESVMFVSPGILGETKDRIEPARRLLPSPFRMLAAMNLE